MAETRYAGRSASPGLAAGRIVPLAGAVSRRIATDDPDCEAASLRAAMARAATELAALAASALADAAEVLGFQLALLDDDALSDSAFSAILGGIPADVAWRAALEIGRASCREKSVDLGGRRIIKKKKKKHRPWRRH